MSTVQVVLYQMDSHGEKGENLLLVAKKIERNEQENLI